MSQGIQNVTAGCRSETAVFNLIGDKWTLMIVGTLWDKPRRFGELRRALPEISQRVLTLTLRELERDGLLNRTVTPTIPVRVDYELTELGRSLGESARPLWHWGTANKDAMANARAAYDSRQSDAA